MYKDHSEQGHLLELTYLDSKKLRTLLYLFTASYSRPRMHESECGLPALTHLVFTVSRRWPQRKVMLSNFVLDKNWWKIEKPPGLEGFTMLNHGVTLR